MKKRQFLMPLAALATSMIANTALADAPDTAISSSAKELTSIIDSNNKKTTDFKNLMDFVLVRSLPSTLVAWHSSHASHSSHSSHSSHYSSSSASPSSPSTSPSSPTTSPSSPSDPFSSHTSHSSHASHASHSSHYSSY